MHSEAEQCRKMDCEPLYPKFTSHSTIDVRGVDLSTIPTLSDRVSAISALPDGGDGFTWENYNLNMRSTDSGRKQHDRIVAELKNRAEQLTDQEKTHFVVIFKDQATGDVTRDMRYQELAQKKIKPTEKNIKEYLKCCGEFQYDSYTPVYVKREPDEVKGEF